MKYLWLLVLLFLPGCFGQSMKLDQEWLPLTEIVEAPEQVMPAHTVTTINDKCYVLSLKDFIENYPEGSVARHALLLHEQQHAVRQRGYSSGVSGWLALYIANRNFRWQEEKAGWKLEILYNRDHGYYVDVDNIAAILNSEYRFGGRMVSFAEAKQWVLDVLAGVQ